MTENDRCGEQPAAIQTDKESQDYGAQHGQTPQGQETGSSSPTARPQPEGTSQDERPEDEQTGRGTGARGGEYS